LRYTGDIGTGHRSWRMALGSAAILAGLVGSALTIRHWRHDAALDRGRALFQGQHDLKGRIFGHDAALPAEASRCTNCHPAPGAPRGTAAANEASRLEGVVGPELGPAALGTARTRRNGPPSRFDPASFCRLLRDGIDPVDVVISRTMPRYPLSDEDCDALWRYLTWQHAD
jgi:hypothetical protein